MIGRGNVTEVKSGKAFNKVSDEIGAEYYEGKR